MKPGLLFLCSILFFAFTATAQKIYTVTLEPRLLPIAGREFYVSRVFDDRMDTTTIGIVQTGALNSRRTAMFDHDASVILQEYFDEAIPKTGEQTPIIVRIQKLRIEERTAIASETGWADLVLDFYSGKTLLYRSSQHKEFKGMDVTASHPDNIMAALESALIEFNTSGWKAKSPPEAADERQPEDTTAEVPVTIPRANRPYSPDKEKNGNVMAVGYQLGGFALIGVEYEIRFHDYFGVNFGAGFLGYTAGMKIHTRPGKNAPFFNLSYKDAGFGLLQTAGVEYGGRIRFSKKAELALHSQIGLAKILKINPTYAAIVYKGNPVPPMTLTAGIGLSW